MWRFTQRHVDLEEIRQLARRGTRGERRKAVFPHRQEDWASDSQLTRVGEELDECEDPQVSDGFRQRCWTFSIVENEMLV